MIIQKKTYEKIKKLLPILCVDCLVIRENKCLLLHRLNHPAKKKMVVAWRASIQE